MRRCQNRCDSKNYATSDVRAGCLNQFAAKMDQRAIRKDMQLAANSGVEGMM